MNFTVIFCINFWTKNAYLLIYRLSVLLAFSFFFWNFEGPCRLSLPRNQPYNWLSCPWTTDLLIVLPRLAVLPTDQPWPWKWDSLSRPLFRVDLRLFLLLISRLCCLFSCTIIRFRLIHHFRHSLFSNSLVPHSISKWIKKINKRPRKGHSIWIHLLVLKSSSLPSLRSFTEMSSWGSRRCIAAPFTRL